MHFLTKTIGSHLKTYNKDAFVKDLINVPWHVAFDNLENVNDCVYVWNKLFTDVMNEHAPLKTRIGQVVLQCRG